MKMTKAKLVSIIKEEINRDLKHYKGSAKKGEFGDYLWPDLHISYDKVIDADIETNTFIEDEVLNSLKQYYSQDIFMKNTTMPMTVIDTIKKAVIARDYPLVFYPYQGVVYRGMALFKEDYERLFSNKPDTYKLTAVERKKFNMSGEGEKPYYDPIMSKISISSVGLINYYERFITGVERAIVKTNNFVRSFVPDNITKKIGWKEEPDIHSYEGTILRDIPVTDEDYHEFHTREYQHDSSPVDRFSTLDRDMYQNYAVELGISDWNTNSKRADNYAMNAAIKLKKIDPSREVIPFMIVCDTTKTKKGVFVDLYTGISSNYPTLKRQLLYLQKGDIMLIGDADIERIKVFDSRGLGLKENTGSHASIKRNKVRNLIRESIALQLIESKLSDAEKEEIRKEVESSLSQKYITSAGLAGSVGDFNTERANYETEVEEETEKRIAAAEALKSDTIQQKESPIIFKGPKIKKDSNIDIEKELKNPSNADFIIKQLQSSLKAVLSYK